MEEPQYLLRKIRTEIQDVLRRTPAEQGEPIIHFIPVEKEEGEHSEACPRKEPTTIRRLGVFPGSFNPLTVAHVELIRRAREKFHLDEVILVLDAQAMDKEIQGATLEDRLWMLRLFARSCPGYRVAFSSHGRFLDKLRAFSRLCPDVQEFCFIVGYDTIVRVLDPKYYDDRERALAELFRGSRFLVANRADDGLAELQTLLVKTENRRFKDRVDFFSLPAPQAHISSTMVREKVAQGGNIRGLVPPAIFRFIRETRLYAPLGG